MPDIALQANEASQRTRKAIRPTALVRVPRLQLARPRSELTHRREQLAATNDTFVVLMGFVKIVLARQDDQKE
jgi:hypothetical protein